MNFAQKLFKIVFLVIAAPLAVIFWPLFITAFVTGMAVESDWDTPETFALVVAGTAASVAWIIYISSLLLQQFPQ